MTREQMIDQAVRRTLMGPYGDRRYWFKGSKPYKLTSRAPAWKTLVPDIRAAFRRITDETVNA